MRILLVTHEASRSGAPRVALMAVTALREQGHNVSVVSRRRGPLLNEFESRAPTRVELFSRARARLWRTRHLALLALVVDTLLAAGAILRSRPDLVYLNSTSCAVYLRPALWLRRRVVIHAHESARVATQFLTPAHSQSLLPRATLIACSPSVRAELALLAGVAPEEIAMVPSVPDAALVRSGAADAVQTVAPGDLLVGCCGAAERRKGADLWPTIAAQVRVEVPAAQFVWIGETREEGLESQADGVHFVGAANNPYAQMGQFDIAVLPSRDDPFPLVVLEAMLLGVPVVAFDVGGVALQLGDTGVLVPAGDLGAMCAEISSLARDPDRRLELGRRARQRAESTYSVGAFNSAITTAAVRAVPSCRQ